MSGHCDFCDIWHSGFCCHPGRVKLEFANAEIQAYYNEAADGWGKFRQAESQLIALQAKVEKLRDAIIEALRHHLSPSHIWEATKVLEQALTDTEEK